MFADGQLQEDSKKPVHLQGAHVLKTYETQLIKARREYEHEMKHSLQASVLLRTSGTGVIEGLDSTRTPAGGRHPNVDTLIEVCCDCGFARLVWSRGKVTCWLRLQTMRSKPIGFCLDFIKARKDSSVRQRTTLSSSSMPTW